MTVAQQNREYASLRIGTILLISFALYIAPFASANNITSCGAINASGNYTLINDLSPTAGVCLHITAPSVYLTCEGRQIASNHSGVTGILVTETEATIDNCKINLEGNYSEGIVIENTTNSTLTGLIFDHNTQALRLTNSSQANIERTYLLNNLNNIKLIQTTYARIIQTRAVAPTTILELEQSNFNVIEDLWTNICLGTQGCIKANQSSFNQFRFMVLRTIQGPFMHILGEYTENNLTSSRFESNRTLHADMDDGSGTGTPDGLVDTRDRDFFLQKFEAGTLEADLDNGSGTGTPDQGVDINDLLYFLEKFDAETHMRDIILSGEGNYLSAISSTYAGTEETGATNRVDRAWYYRVLVSNGTNPLENATVNITDNQSFNQTMLTNENGTTQLTILRSYTNLNNTQEFYQYSISATHEGYLEAQIGRGILSNDEDTLILALDDFGIGNQTNGTGLPQQNQTQPPRTGDGSCIAGWICDAWSPCNEGTQTRICRPANSICIGDYARRPSLTQLCLVPLAEPIALSNPQEATRLRGVITGAVIGEGELINFGMIGILLLLLAILGLYIVMNRARIAQQKKIAQWLKVLEWTLLGIIGLLLLVTLFFP